MTLPECPEGQPRVKGGLKLRERKKEEDGSKDYQKKKAMEMAETVSWDRSRRG